MSEHLRQAIYHLLAAAHEAGDGPARNDLQYIVEDALEVALYSGSFPPEEVFEWEDVAGGRLPLADVATKYGVGQQAEASNG